MEIKIWLDSVSEGEPQSSSAKVAPPRPPFSLCEVQSCVGRLTAQTETLTGSVKPPPTLAPALSTRLSVFFKADNADVKLFFVEQLPAAPLVLLMCLCV